jgi:hypothetical protein
VNVLAPAAHVNQSASEIPAGGASIANNLCLRCKRESDCRQGLGRDEFCGGLSRPLNGYAGMKNTRGGEAVRMTINWPWGCGFFYGAILKHKMSYGHYR